MKEVALLLAALLTCVIVYLIAYGFSDSFWSSVSSRATEEGLSCGAAITMEQRILQRLPAQVDEITELYAFEADCTENVITYDYRISLDLQVIEAEGLRSAIRETFPAHDCQNMQTLLRRGVAIIRRYEDKSLRRFETIRTTVKSCIDLVEPPASAAEPMQAEWTQQEHSGLRS